MSKPVSNSDIEGVLSSVRRLVRDTKASGAPDEGSQSPGRLILSPKQRVPAVGALRLQPEDVVQVPDAFDRDVAITATARAGGVISARAASGHDASNPVSAEKPRNETGSTTIKPGDVHVEGSNKDKPAGDALKAKIAALETAIAKTAGQWEPDGVSKDDYAGTQASGMAWPERVDLGGAGVSLDVSDQPSGGEDMLSDNPDEDQILDEDGLRELVAEIVRSELQGALGARITRNLRKMVRREIHRAMAARDLG